MNERRSSTHSDGVVTLYYSFCSRYPALDDPGHPYTGVFVGKKRLMIWRMHDTGCNGHVFNMMAPWDFV